MRYAGLATLLALTAAIPSFAQSRTAMPDGQGPLQAPGLRRHAQGRQPAQVRYRHGVVGGSAGPQPQDLIGFLSELHSLGIDLALHQQGIDTTTPAGKAMFQMMGVVAEFERSMIVERVRAGVARAKAGGTRSGKAFGRPRVPAETEQQIRDALATRGRPGFHKIAAQFGVATGTVQRIANG
jgi:hypothetical protein